MLRKWKVEQDNRVVEVAAYKGRDLILNLDKWWFLLQTAMNDQLHSRCGIGWSANGSSCTRSPSSRRHYLKVGSRDWSSRMCSARVLARAIHRPCEALYVQVRDSKNQRTISGITRI